ncbi:MAG: hypothetical protein ACRDRA_08430 [Pseudonocardiaceae bacterium]
MGLPDLRHGIADRRARRTGAATTADVTPTSRVNPVVLALDVSTGNQRVLLHRARAAVRSSLHARRADLIPA